MTDTVNDDTIQDAAQANASVPEPGQGRFADRDTIFGDSPEGTDVWQRVPYDPADYGPVEDFATWDRFDGEVFGSPGP